MATPRLLEKQTGLVKNACSAPGCHISLLLPVMWIKEKKYFSMPMCLSTAGKQKIKRTWFKKNGRAYASLQKWRHSCMFKMPTLGPLGHMYYLSGPCSHLNSPDLRSTQTEKDKGKRWAGCSRPPGVWASVALAKRNRFDLCATSVLFHSVFVCSIFDFIS